MQKRGMVGKRGQVTIFILIAIIMLAVSAGIFFIMQNFTTQSIGDEIGKTVSSEPIKLFIEECLKSSVVDATKEVLSNGGYTKDTIHQMTSSDNLLEFANDNEMFSVPYYFQEDNSQIVSMNKIETETAKESTILFNDCINEFTVFENEGQEIQVGDATIQVKFVNDLTTANLNYPLTIIEREKEMSISEFSVTIPFNFEDKHSLISQFLSLQEEDPNFFLVSELSELAYENNLGLEFDQLNEDGSDILVSLSSNDVLSDEPIVYNFALNYDWTLGSVELDFPEPSIPELILHRIKKWIINENGVQNFQISASGENITYGADNDDFYLDSTTGMITLDTVFFPNDEYWYFAQAKDGYGRQVTAPFYIDINVNPGNYPIIKEIDEIYANVGEEFEYRIEILNNPENKPLLFTIDDYLFDFDKATGTISFTPAEDDIGRHSIRVDVENEFGRMWERFDLVIE
jgi:hypothetical protein